MKRIEQVFFYVVVILLDWIVEIMMKYFVHEEIFG
jgi:hypothetical protein